MKKNKGLIIGVIIVIIILAVAAWYFFFRNATGAKMGDIIDMGNAGGTGPADQPVCPPGTTGVWPACVQTVVNQDTIFANAVVAAKQNITNNSTLTSVQKSNAASVIDLYVVKDKDLILADAASGKDIVELILGRAQDYYLTTYGVSVRLTTASRATSGRG